MKTALITILLICVAVVGVLGFRGRLSTTPPLQYWNDMTDQAKYLPQKSSAFFADGRVDRLPPAGVLPWGRVASRSDDDFLIDDHEAYKATVFPSYVTVDRNFILRGKMLFENNCRICHGATGAGNGMTTLYGMNNPPSYFLDRLKAAPPGYFYQVITEGRGQMGPYGPNIKPRDRWAIAAYIRVLQRAASGTINDVPEERRAEMDK